MAVPSLPKTVTSNAAIEISFDTFSVLDGPLELGNVFALGYPQPPDMDRSNAFYHFLGEQPSRGWLLLSRGDLEQLSLNAPHTLTFADPYGNGLKLQNLWIVKARNVTPGETGDPAACYLVEIADVRYKLADQFLGIGINKQYNVRAPAWGGMYYEDSRNAGSDWTWLTLIRDLWATMPQLGTAPAALPAGVVPDTKPESFIFPGVSAWKALNQVLYRIGCAVKADLTLASNQFSLVQIGASDGATADAVAVAGGRLIYDAEYLSPTSTRIPGNVRVFSHGQQSDYGAENGTGQAAGKQWTLTSALVKNDKAATASGSDSQLFHPLWDDLPALFDDNDSNTNAAALSTRATEHAAAWLKMITPDRVQQIFSGVLAVQPGSMLKAVIYRQDLVGVGDPEGNRGGLVTEIVNHPFWTVAIGEGGRLEMRDDYPTTTQIMPPDFVPGYPVYPHYLQTLKLTTGNVDGVFTDLYSAVVERLAEASRLYSDQETIWALEMNGVTRPLAKNKRYPCRLSGYSAGRPLYQFLAETQDFFEVMASCEPMATAAMAVNTSLYVMASCEPMATAAIANNQSMYAMGSCEPMATACYADPDTDIECKAYNSGTQTLTHGGSVTALTADSEVTDTHNFHSTSSNTSRMTFTTGGAGKYLVFWSLKAKVTFSGTDKTPEYTEFVGKVNGSTEVQGSRQCCSFWRITAIPNSTATSATSFELDHNCLSGSFIFEAAATDYLEMFGDPSANTLDVAVSNFTLAIVKANRAGGVGGGP